MQSLPDLRRRLSVARFALYDNPNALKLMLLLLVSAAPDDRRRGDIQQPRGTAITTVAEICDLTGMTIQQVRTAMGALARAGEITPSRRHRCTAIAIARYDLFQASDAEFFARLVARADATATTTKQQLPNQSPVVTNDLKSRDLTTATGAKPGSSNNETTTNPQSHLMYKEIDNNQDKVLTPSPPPPAPNRDCPALATTSEGLGSSEVSQQEATSPLPIGAEAGKREERLRRHLASQGLVVARGAVAAAAAKSDEYLALWLEVLREAKADRRILNPAYLAEWRLQSGKPVPQTALAAVKAMLAGEPPPKTPPPRGRGAPGASPPQGQGDESEKREILATIRRIRERITGAQPPPEPPPRRWWRDEVLTTGKREHEHARGRTTTAATDLLLEAHPATGGPAGKRG